MGTRQTELRRDRSPQNNNRIKVLWKKSALGNNFASWVILENQVKKGLAWVKTSDPSYT